MPNENIIQFRPRAALTTCTLPEDDCEYDDETSDEGEELPPIASRPYSIDVFDGEGGKSLLDACLPTHIAMAAVAFIMKQLEMTATA
jgi:hypothetical protein